MVMVWADEADRDEKGCAPAAALGAGGGQEGACEREGRGAKFLHAS